MTVTTETTATATEAELAEAENADRFDGVWEAIYDEADYDRVWIDTFSR